MRANVAKNRVRLAAACVWLALLVPPAVAADARAKFIADNLCQIVVRLDMIHARRDEPDRYLVVSLADDNAQYAQCLFLESDTQLLCEVASGFYTVAEGTPAPQVRESFLAIIAAAGFSTDYSDGNFQRLILIENVGPDFHDVAGLLLGLMYDFFGAREDDDLTYTAPLADVSPEGLACRKDLSQRGSHLSLT